MTPFQRLLLIPCLAPLLALLVLSALNPGDKTRIRLFIWTTPSLSLGAWTSLAAGSGAVGAALTAFILRPVERPLRRTHHSPVQPRFREDGSEAHPSNQRSTAAPGPERDIREPAPTVSVAYRVVQRPSSESRSEKPSPVPTTPKVSGAWGDDPDADW